MIGPGGATIRALIEEFSLMNVDIQEGTGEGVVTITSLRSFLWMLSGLAKSDPKVKRLRLPQRLCRYVR